jgi:hypothetical protein
MNVIESAPKQSTATKVFSTIKSLIPTLGGWTSVPKAHTYAALVLGYRPEVCVEIGVWEGRGSLAIALALQEVGRGMLYSIDAWDPKASIEGQTHPGDIEHWGKSDHEGPYQSFLTNISKHNLGNFVTVMRLKSEHAGVPANIGFLVIDGNHGDTSIIDVKRFAPAVKKGGFVYMDDLDWSTGSVRRAESKLKEMGFVEQYRIENGAMYQRL